MTDPDQAGPRFPLGLVIATSLVVASSTLAAVLWARAQPARPSAVRVVAPEIAIPLPEFALVDQAGAPFGSADLAGQVWVADFVFTRCDTICPRLSESLAWLQGELQRSGRADVRLVSFSVDPEHDRPEVLARYAASYQADPARWRFLTGERVPLWTLIRDGFKLPVDYDARDDPARLIFHSGKLALVDRRGQVRGYFGGVEPPPEERARLLAAIDELRAEPAP